MILGSVFHIPYTIQRSKKTKDILVSVYPICQITLGYHVGEKLKPISNRQIHGGILYWADLFIQDMYPFHWADLFGTKNSSLAAWKPKRVCGGSLEGRLTS